MKKFSVRKISALVLVFCLFVSVLANTGTFAVRAEEEVSTGASASFKYAGTSGYWFGVTGYANADKTDWPSTGWLTEGTSSDGNVTVSGGEGSWIISWDTTNVSEVYVTFGANINGTNYEVYKTLGDGAAITMYDGTDGLTTEAPAVEEPETPAEPDANLVSANFVYEGTLTDIGFGVNGGNDINWQWVGGDAMTDVTGTVNGNTYTVTWDANSYNDVQIWISSNSFTGGWGGLWPSAKAGETVTIYSTADGFTLEKPATEEPETPAEPEDTTTATATVTYAGASTSYWFGSSSCANADKTAWPSYDWLSSGSNDYITIAQNGTTWTVTWDTSKVSEVYAEFGANINGVDQKIWPTLGDGTAITYYDAADGTLTTEQPKSTASINYLGTAGDPIIIVNSYVDAEGNTVAANDGWWVQASDENFTFGEGNKSVTWTNPNIKSINAIIGGMINGSWVSDLKVTMGPGTVIDVYDNADASNFSVEAPAATNFTATATITYMGSQSTWTYSDGAWVIADQAWVNAGFGGPGSNEYAAISHSGNTYSISWDPETANPNFRFGVWGDYEDEFAPELYDGAAYVLYDGDGELTTELPTKYASAKIVYMGAHTDTWTTAYGLTPRKTYADGWWLNDSASPSNPIGTYTMCYASGNTYTYTWDADVASTCWVLFGCNSYAGDAPYFGLKDGSVVYLYDKDILGHLSTEPPMYYTCSVEVRDEQESWSGVTALCLTTGNWVNGLWIDSNSNDYGITVTKTTENGKTVYTYTYDKSQISTICVETGTTTLSGSKSQIWTNFSNNSTRRFYIAEETGCLTTFPPGYTYVKAGAGEGIDGTLKVHYIREDGDYSGWYFGYWYEVNGEWFSYNKTFSSEGIYALGLIDIPADKIGFVVNYNDWASKDIEEDRFIEISKLVADEYGDYNVYLYSGDATVYYEPKA